MIPRNGIKEIDIHAFLDFWTVEKGRRRKKELNKLIVCWFEIWTGQSGGELWCTRFGYRDGWLDWCWMNIS